MGKKYKDLYFAYQIVYYYGKIMNEFYKFPVVSFQG